MIYLILHIYLGGFNITYSKMATFMAASLRSSKLSYFSTDFDQIFTKMLSPTEFLFSDMFVMPEILKTDMITA